ncbi:Gfo/Idh/MocA family oxidoreductase [Clostridium sp. 19966]|uniref:Gfo/Idh/MocA family protein n=1 Tax=Clostridium sp. 19966 TaxID=2768166 RepID=UPI0028DFC3B3|nr:Gfo/Idh/MocA family oxidoreductase [Clostridium sp. 19966]MDT8717408.1 Gfo/Idh/MocA family oxidoreductase [Clostridium sp. 19966]
MKIGILGTGFGAYHTKIYNNIPEVESITVYGRDIKKLHKLKEDLNVKITTNIEEIFMDESITLIDVCLPSAIHSQYALKALEYGKHVFCETPVCLNLQDAENIKNAAEKYDKKAFVDMFIRFEPAYEYLYKIIKDNSLGKLRTLNIKRKTPPIWGDLGLNKIITSLMLHEFDFISWILGDTSKVSAIGMSGKEGQSHVEALLNYDEALVEIQCSSMMPYYHAFTVGYEAAFDEGTLEFVENGYENKSESSFQLFTDNKHEILELANENCYEKALNHVIKCCVSNTESRLDIKDSIISLEIALHANRLINNR